MISKKAYKFVEGGKIWEVEGFEKAALSAETFHLHHKIGALCNIPQEKLIDSGLYFDRPPYELVFLSSVEHRRIHEICNDPRVREGLRRLEMQRWYASGYPLDNLLLDSYGCNKLNKEFEDESEEELLELNNKCAEIGINWSKL